MWSHRVWETNDRRKINKEREKYNRTTCAHTPHDERRGVVGVTRVNAFLLSPVPQELPNPLNYHTPPSPIKQSPKTENSKDKEREKRVFTHTHTHTYTLRQIQRNLSKQHERSAGRVFFSIFIFHPFREKYSQLYIRWAHDISITYTTTTTLYNIYNTILQNGTGERDEFFL